MRRWNLPLALGCLLGLGLIILLMLPFFMNLRSPNVGQLVFPLGDIPVRPPLRPGTEGFLLGTDRIGRDLFARFVFGARYTLGVALGVTMLRALIAVPLGLFVGWYGGRLNQIVSTLSASFISIPTLVFTALFLRGLRNIVTRLDEWLLVYCAVLVVAGLPRMVEFVRQRTQEIVVMPYVEAAVAVGAPGPRIMRRHLFPIMKGDVLIMLASEMAWVLLMMGQLAVIGVYVSGTIEVVLNNRPVTVEFMAEWSQMLGANLWEFKTNPWIPMTPTIALCMAGACFHLLAEGLRLRQIAR